MWQPAAATRTDLGLGNGWVLHRGQPSSPQTLRRCTLHSSLLQHLPTVASSRGRLRHQIRLTMALLP